MKMFKGSSQGGETHAVRAARPLLGDLDPPARQRACPPDSA